MQSKMQFNLKYNSKTNIVTLLIAISLFMFTFFLSQTAYAKWGQTATIVNQINNTTSDDNNSNITKNILINVTIDVENNSTIANQTFDVIVNLTNSSGKINGLNSSINSTINVSVTNKTKEKEPSFLILPTFSYAKSAIRFHEAAINGTTKDYSVGVMYIKKPLIVALQGFRNTLKYDYNSTYNTKYVYGNNKSDYFPNEIKTEGVSFTNINSLSTIVFTYTETTTNAFYNPMLFNDDERKDFFKKVHSIKYDNYSSTNKYKYKGKSIMLLYTYKLSDVLSPGEKYFYSVGAIIVSKGKVKNTIPFPYASAGYNITNTTTITTGFDNLIGLQYNNNGLSINTGLNSMNFQRNVYVPFNLQASYSPNEIINVYGTYTKQAGLNFEAPLPKNEKELTKNNTYTSDSYNMILRYTSYEGGVKINLSGLVFSLSYASLEDVNYFIPESNHPTHKIAERSVGNADMYKFGVSFGS